MDPTVKILDGNKKIEVARTMYLAGFALLPWMWMVNYLMFRKDAIKASTPHDLKVYTSRSLLLSLITFSLALLWFIIYQSSWTRWGTLGEKLALNIPKGGYH